MIEFKSLIKVNEDYIDIDDIIYFNQVKDIDWDYIEGKIIILFYGNKVFGLDVVDDINWFWGFVADGFDLFFETGVYDISFPSQPIAFTLIRINKSLVNLKIFSENIVYLNKDFGYAEFLNSFFKAAIRYFIFEQKFNESESSEMKRKICLMESFKKNIQS